MREDVPIFMGGLLCDAHHDHVRRGDGGSPAPEGVCRPSAKHPDACEQFPIVTVRCQAHSLGSALVSREESGAHRAAEKGGNG
jgi:hypothetical protein